LKIPKIKCNFKNVIDIWQDSYLNAANVAKLNLTNYQRYAEEIATFGRGAEPVLNFICEVPEVIKIINANILDDIYKMIVFLQKSPNSKAITIFLQHLPAIARNTESVRLLSDYFFILRFLSDKTSLSVHGSHSTHPSVALPVFIQKSASLLKIVNVAGLRKWAEYGCLYFKDNPEHQKEFFALKTPDSKSMLQRQRAGTLLINAESALEKYTKALWDIDITFRPQPVQISRENPVGCFLDENNLFMPDVYEKKNSVSAKDRYLAQICHVSAHIKWGQQIVGDNLSPTQRFFIEMFEDCRVEYLAMQKYPGLRYLWTKLHPVPIDNDCNEKNISCIRHRMAQLSLKILNDEYHCSAPVVNEFAARFIKIMKDGSSSTQECKKLGVEFAVKSKQISDSYKDLYFENTLIDYRDDNRHMWLFHEESDEPEDMLERKKPEEEQKTYGIAYLYDEWDYTAKIYKPDWVTLYESKHSEGNAQIIENILTKHQKTTKRLKILLDALRAQDHIKVRHQEHGTELDTDTAISSFIDYKSGKEPDLRINMNTIPNQRNIAVSLLLDLSASGNEKIAHSNQTILELSQEAISVLSWAIDQLQDKYSIAGFNSNGRHFSGFYHIKGYSERFDDKVKKRLAAMSAGLSTRMGSAMRHAGNILENQAADKKILLIITDGEPADIDIKDHNTLIEDAKVAQTELKEKNIWTYCINLDKKSDEYVKRIFNNNWTIIDNLLSLPEKLAQIFIQLTK
jgi:nitric oxide reductase NorD protein